MANFIANSNLSPEYLESNLKAILNPTITFKATLTSGGPTTVAVVGQDNLTYGSFTLDTLNQVVSSGPIANLAPQLKYVVTSGFGNFNITCNAGI